MAEDASAPVKITAEQLGISVGEEYEGQLEYDIGNLTAYDPAPLDSARFIGEEGDETLHEVARAITQSLINKLFTQPSESVQGGRLASLPVPTTLLPREKPLPKPKPLTKWQKFAQEKGIVKRKRSKLEFDEPSGEWKRRHGYGRGNDELDVPIIEAKATDKVGEDPFTALAEARDQRVKKNRKQQLENVKTMVKKGGGLPTTLKLSASLPQGDDRGDKRKRKELKSEIHGAHIQAGVSTASMGKFDKRLVGEKEGERMPAGKRRKFMAVTDTQTERAQLTGLADKFLRERADDIIDIKKAIHRYESETGGEGPSGGKGSGRGGSRGGGRGGSRGGGRGGSRGGGRGGGEGGGSRRGGRGERGGGRGRSFGGSDSGQESFGGRGGRGGRRGGSSRGRSSRGRGRG